MKKILIPVLALLFAAPAIPAQAASTHYPRCIATTWASQHYHAPKTARGETCVVKVRSEYLAGDISDPAGSKFWQVTYVPWYPDSWTIQGFISAKSGAAEYFIVRRPR